MDEIQLEITYNEMKELYSPEVLNLFSVNERFDNESYNIKELRIMYANIACNLIQARGEAGGSEARRNYSIAITELENSCIRAIKGIYSK